METFELQTGFGQEQPFSDVFKLFVKINSISEVDRVVRKLRPVVIGVVLALILVSCVPVPIKTTYYLASGGGTAIAVAGCSGGKSHLEISLPGAIILRISAYPADRYGKMSPGYRNQAETVNIHLSFLVPAGQQVQLTSDKFLLTANQTSTSQELVLAGFKQIYTFDQVQARDYAATEELKGATKEVTRPIGSYLEKAFYSGRYILIDPAIQEFQLELPPLVVNGVEMKMAPTSFQFRDEYVMTGLCP